MPQCVFKSCKNNARKTKISDGVSYFRFPTNSFTFAKWVSIVATERRDEFYEPAKNSVICSEHFDEFDITGNTNRRRLVKTAVPKIQLQVSERVPVTFNMPGCVFRYCKNYDTKIKKDGGVGYHAFPSDELMKHKWIGIVQAERSEYDWIPSTSSKICSVHFKDKDKYTTPKGNVRLKKSAVPTVLSLAATESPNQSKRKHKPQKQTYDPFKEYANDSTDEETTDIKEETSDAGNSEDDDTEDGTPKTEKVFVKSLSSKGKQSIDGRSQPKRSRFDPEENLDTYEEEDLYEFGKYVAEQLLCLDVEDARVARMEIVAVLSKFAPKRIREPRTSKAKKQKAAKTVASVSSKSQLQVATQPQFVNVNTAEPSNITMNISEPSMSQQVNIPGSSASQTAQENPLETKAVVEPAVAQYAVMNVSQGSSGAPLGYIVMPAGPRFGTGQKGNTEVTTETISSIAPRSSNVVSAGPLVAQTSDMEFAEVAVKTELESEDTSQLTKSSHVNVFGSDSQETLIVKYEQQSDGERET